MRPVTVLSLCVLLASSPAGAAGEGPEWHADLDAAFALAAESGRPLLIVFR